MSESAAKKDVQKLQRAIVDGLEDVKGHDIRVFNTEHLSPLFERVIVASGSSNRQTKALAASVRDKVRDGGFNKPRIEGEENGEWIIVDCGAAVAHIMQPAIRQYYNLEEIWGEKPVRLKGPEARAAGTQRKSAAKGEEEATPARAGKAPAAAKKVAKAASGGSAIAQRAAAKKAPARKAPAKKAAAKAPARKAPAKSPARKSAAGSAAPLKTVVVNKPTARSAPKAAAKAPAKTPARTAAKKSAPRAGR